MKSKGLLALLGLGVVAAGALLLMPKKASAATAAKPLSGGAGPLNEGQGAPQTPDEAYALAMNPSMKDANYVHQLALWLNSSGQRPDWAAAAEKRATDLRAEQVLADGLKQSTSLQAVAADAQQLGTVYQSYANVLAQRIAVQNGQQAAPAPFVLPLLSGGSLNIDLSIYAPGAAPVNPSFVASSAPVPTPATQATPAPAHADYPANAPPGMTGWDTNYNSPAPKPSAATPLNSASDYLPTPQALPPSPPPPTAATPATTTPPPAPPTPVALPTTAPPIAHEELKPENDPYGTLALIRSILDEQNRTGWKHVNQAVKDWQTRKGLTADGKLGVGSVLTMAKEAAVLPWVQYYSTGVGDGSKTAAVNDFRGRLKSYALSIAKTDPDHAAALLAAADKEDGQGWPKTVTAAPAVAISMPTLTVYRSKLGVAS